VNGTAAGIVFDSLLGQYFVHRIVIQQRGINGGVDELGLMNPPYMLSHYGKLTYTSYAPLIGLLISIPSTLSTTASCPGPAESAR